MRILLWVAVFCLSLSTALFAQSANPEPPGTAAAATPPPAETGPVPVPEPSEKALQYHRGGNWLWVFSKLWG
ncbi:MAG: hypothetical protein ACREX9_22010, partial [Gammaproteobacteria bacterium]